MSRLRLLSAAGALVLVGSLAACASPAQEPDDGIIHVVASTNVYGDIATTIGGKLVEVTSIIDDPAQDPHSFEADARVQLALSKADVVIENGGGYDDFVDTLLAGANNADATVLNAADISGFNQKPAEGEFNEHVWYSFDAMGSLTDALVDALSKAAPESAATFKQNGADFHSGLDALTARTDALAAQHAGVGVAYTEPVPGYLLAAAGLKNVTPDEFSEAIEEGTDVSPTVLAETIALFTSGTAELLVYNEQTTGPETEKVLTAATGAGVPVVPVTETLPAGSDYLGWMGSNIDAIQAALS